MLKIPRAAFWESVLSVTIGFGEVSRWRFFASIVFVNQIVRVPLLLSLASSVNDLDVYFVVSATSIPVQFIAQEICQYHTKYDRLQPFERIGLPLLACGSIFYITWRNGFAIGGLYLVFAIALLIHGVSVGQLRAAFPAVRILAMDAVYNSGITILSVAIVLLMNDNTKIGYAIVLSQSAIASLVCFLNLFAVRCKQDFFRPTKTLKSPAYKGTGDTATLVLVSIMTTTQLERLVIAASQPAVLAYISLASGVTQAWRKIGMDDAVVFAKMRRYRDDGLYPIMCSELKHARFVFYPPLLFALVANIFINEIAAWCTSYGLFRSLDSTSFAITGSILCVYLSVMPPAIVTINALRQRALPLARLGWSALGVVALVQIIALAFPYSTVLHINLAMAMIILTASLFYFLFMALSPVRLRRSFNILLLDIAVFFIVIGNLVWVSVQ